MTRVKQNNYLEKFPTKYYQTKSQKGKSMRNFNKMPFVTLSALAAIGLFGLSACSKKEEAKAPEAAPTEAAAVNTAAPAEVAVANSVAAAPAADAISDADKAKLATLPAPYNTADLANGKRQFALCKACHTIGAGEAAKTGPNLHGIVGKKSGTSVGFTYSDAMKAAGKTWDIATIDAYLKNPKTFVAGNKMAFAGIPSDANRRDAVAYVAVESAK